MSEATHTPGPWAVAPSSNKGNGSGWRDIVSLGGEFSPAYVGEAIERDAVLIAAAPELLAALESVCNWADMFRDSLAYESGRSQIDAARAAIQKATGAA